MGCWSVKLSFKRQKALNGANYAPYSKIILLQRLASASVGAFSFCFRCKCRDKVSACWFPVPFLAVGGDGPPPGWWVPAAGSSASTSVVKFHNKNKRAARGGGGSPWVGMAIPGGSSADPPEVVLAFCRVVRIGSADIRRPPCPHGVRWSYGAMLCPCIAVKAGLLFSLPCRCMGKGYAVGCICRLEVVALGF